ncbi:MAG: UDP-N-acetylglucosamine 2-epimerase (hydrolyzing) [Dehalococcoidia bacterium]|nr:UDP-N-acetylglucosamine 2-epimerase (hydrolyzing) [Dehalococcoidia bacterium]
MRKIAVVTGTRAEYGILLPVLKAIEIQPELMLSLVVTGMHLSHEFGYTVREIEHDGFTVDARVDMLLSSDMPGAMAKSVGMGVIGMAQTWEQLKPEIILVLGDRVEPLAATIAAAYINIPVAHVHGGDVCGSIDSPARHAITKFAHIHFPATKKSAERIAKMGEEEWRVHIVGSPALDAILSEPLIPAEDLARRLQLDLSQPLILLVQHSVTTQADDAPQQIKETLQAVVELGHPTILIYPNSDAGGRRMIQVISEHGKYPFIKTFKSLPHKEYLSLMKAASLMMGNSSSGIVEAPSFGLPVINIGIRQLGRERGENVINVGHDKQEIIEAVEKALTDKDFLKEVKKCDNPYGDGKTAPRIAEILSKTEITPELIQKKPTY